MEDAVKEIWGNFDKQLKGLIGSRMKNHDECNDVLQEVYVKIIKNIDRISTIENLPSYLASLAKNAVNDYYRSQTKKPFINAESFDNIIIIDETQGDKELANDCCFECLEPGINTLPPIYKEALIMSELQGMPQKEVAEKLGITLSGAKSRVQRAREKLKDEVLKCCYNGRF